MSSGAPLTFGRYEALFHIASGGMAEVFAARLRGPAGFEKLVAVKRLLPDLTNDHFVTMFLDEARLAAQITSPHVVQTLELGRAEDDRALYIVMELVVGVTLFDLCVSVLDGPQGSLPVPVVAEIIAQAARGMGDAHLATTPTGEALHVVHRDISPQNILCGADGRVRVTDFGIARAVSRSTETRAGQLKGKVAYVSPEQARGKKLDARSDVFSLGVVAWEVLTGKSLFNTGDVGETIKRVRSLEIPSPRLLRPEIPEPLANAVLWALDRDLDKRCPSAAHFEKAIRNAIDTSPVRELSTYIGTHGGPSLERMKGKIHDIHAGAPPSPMRRTTTDSTRLVPEAAVSSSRPIGIPTGSVEIQSERNVATQEMRKAQVQPSRGVRPQEAPAGRRKRLSLAIGVGVVAWIAAAVIAYFAIQSGLNPSTPTPLRLETESGAP